jgi:hypothetical protein
MFRYFGVQAPAELPRALRRNPRCYDDQRRWFRIWTRDLTTHEVIEDDWPTLKRAIALTVRNEPLGGPYVRIGDGLQSHIVPARLTENRLEIYIGELVPGIREDWSYHFKNRGLRTR